MTAGAAPASTGAVRRPRWEMTPPLRDRKFAVSSLEGLNSNFRYAGAVNLVVTPFMPPSSGRVAAPSQFSDSTTPCIKA
jgi:hypothetical protein